MANITLKNITKVYAKNVVAVKDFSLEIQDKDFLILVGPSGCGKSTILKMIAGLEDITKGEIYIDGKLVNDAEPKDRDIAMVFQNYALYPHMTVFDNLAFGLKIRKYSKEEIKRKVENTAKILGISEYLKRKPGALSGGQKQRVALGRAIVREPKVFLLDEPLSNLDAKMRTQMRSEITKLHKRLQTTFIYVTHDQVEAMTMGSKIVVMDQGVIQQIATPEQLYKHPKNKFVAGFIGTPQMNIFKGILEKKQDKLMLKLGGHQLEIADKLAEKISANYYGKEVFAGVRAEDTGIEAKLIEKYPQRVLQCAVNIAEDLGNEKLIYLKVDGADIEIVCRAQTKEQIQTNDKLPLFINTEFIYLFDKETELSIIDYNE